MLDLLAPRFPRDARTPCLHAESARGYLALSAAYDIAPSMGGSALEPDHSIAPPPRSQADALTVAPRRGAL